MTWQARLALQYRREGERTVAFDRHEGPLRVLQALYPEGPGICHHVLVHPPGGIVGGDELHLDVEVGAGAQALITTPGATRFYRSSGATALQRTRLRLDAGARLEWLPLETLAYPGCEARNEVTIEAAVDAQVIGWDLVALGLPAAGATFDRGCYAQRIALAGRWLERSRLAATDALLLDGPLGLAGHRVLATAWFAGGSGLGAARREALLDAARAAIDLAAHANGSDGNTGGTGGASAPDERIVVARLLGQRVEPLMATLMAIRAGWRRLAWGLDSVPPRVWRT